MIERYLCERTAIPDITIKNRDVILKKQNQQNLTSMQEGIPRIPVAKRNNKINASIQ
jgi:hypothetical protein